MKITQKIAGLICLLSIGISCHKKQGVDKSKVEINFQKIESSYLQDIEKEKILDSVSQYVLLLSNDSINRNLIFKISNKYYFLNHYDKYLKLLNKVLDLSIQDNDSIHIAKSLCYIGNYYDAKSQYDSAFIYYNKSEKIYKSLNDTLMLGMISILKGGLYYDTGNYTESENETIKALRVVSSIKRNDLIYNCYNIIALSLKGLKNDNKSLEYFDLALKQLDILEKENYSKEKIKKSKIVCLNNIGLVYENQEKYTEAINFYTQGLQTENLKKEYPKSYAMLLDNLAHAKIKLGQFEEVPNILETAMRVSDSLGIKTIIASSKINIGEYYLLKKDTEKGLANIKEGYALSKKIKYNELTLQALKLLSKSDTKNESYYAYLYIKLNDSLQNQERITRNKFARIEYETDQIEENNKTLSKHNTNIIIGSVIIFILLGGLFIIFRLKSKNKQLLLIKDQQEANEQIYQLMLQQQTQNEATRNEERNRIAMELHDGIVNSIFTTRFNLIQLDPNQSYKKQLLVKELENAENEIRRVSHDLQQNLIFEDKNLPVLLENLVKAQHNENSTIFDISIDKFIDWSRISDANKIHIYRIIQEGLQNINKYANAEKAIVFILKTGDKTTIRIWDNGIGFNQEKVKHGIGLNNIKQRIKALKGTLKINTNLNEGSTIEIVF